jgi:hypothetical protein
VLRRNQEVFSWTPETGRYLQVTAEEGRVLGFVLSGDGKRLAYVLGGKLVREHGKADTLHELAVKVMDLASMAAGPSAAIQGDVANVRLSFPVEPELVLTRAGGETASYRLRGSGLEEVPRSQGLPRQEALVISGAGVNPGRAQVKRPGCRFDLLTRQASPGVWKIQVATRGAGARAVKKLTLDARYGAGLPGLPFLDPGARDDKK